MLRPCAYFSYSRKKKLEILIIKKISHRKLTFCKFFESLKEKLQTDRSPYVMQPFRLLNNIEMTVLN